MAWTLTTSTEGTKQKAEGSEDEDEAEDHEEGSKTTKLGGYVLEYDAARKIAQGLGAHLERLPHLVEVKGEKARLLPVSERAKYLFGKDEGKAPPPPKKKSLQQALPGMGKEAHEERAEWGDLSVPALGATVLDRVHQSKILFAAGRGAALKRFLVDSGMGSGMSDSFWANIVTFGTGIMPTALDEHLHWQFRYSLAPGLSVVP